MTAPSETNDLIAHYVLGLMDGEQESRFEARIANEPDLALQVAALQQNFHALDETVTPEPVSEAVWSRIDAALGEGGDVPVAANANTPSATRSVPRWAGLAAAIVLSLGLGYFGGQALGPSSEPPLVVAVLVGDDMEPGAIIEAFADDRIRLVPLEALVAPEDSILEVWTLPDPETGPVSLGTFREARDLVLGGPDLPSPQPDQLYEITLEPAGGSPTGRPTGPILLKGFARTPIV